MKTTSMRSKLFGVMILLAFSLGTQAQNNPREKMTPDQRAAKQTEILKKKLNLSDEQAAKISEINLKYANQNKEARSKMRKKVTEMANKHQADIESVLTPDQIKQYQDLKEKRKMRMQKRIREHRPDKQ